MFQGVNYASAGAGIILSSGSELVILSFESLLSSFSGYHLSVFSILWGSFTVAGPAGFIRDAG